MSDAIDTCGCCEGTQQLTPATIVNRPGLPALAYRVGIHATFLETMLARLSNMGIPLGDLNTILDDISRKDELQFPLRKLTTRSLDDPAIAMLDAWAVVAEVLTFYQERIANEGYLRTATERRSILELTRLIGYKLRPGVAASVFLAYILENGQTTTIPQGSRAQSLPGPGQLPQPFETSFDIDARAVWNAIKPRLSVPQYITQIDQTLFPFIIDPIAVDTDTDNGAVFLDGTSTRLNANDRLLFVFGDTTAQHIIGRIQTVEPNTEGKYTKVTFDPNFTPLAYIRKLLGIIEYYLNFSLFNISATDPRIASVIAELKKEQQTLNDKLNLNLESQPSSIANELIRKRDNLGDEIVFVESSQKQFSSIYKNVVNTDTTAVATWLGGLIRDIRAWLKAVSPQIALSTALTPIVTTNVSALIGPLAKLPSLPPSNGIRLLRSATTTFSRKTDIALQLIGAINPKVDSTVYNALSQADVTAPSALQALYAFRVKATPFGSTAPKQTSSVRGPDSIKTTTTTTEPGKTPTVTTRVDEVSQIFSTRYNEWKLASAERVANNVLYLDAEYNQIVPTSWIFITFEAVPDDSDTNPTVTVRPGVYRVTNVETVARADYGISPKITKLTLNTSWFSMTNVDTLTLRAFRGVTVYAQSEELKRAEEPLTDDIRGDEVELDDLYDGLQSGRWVVVSGERTDIVNTKGVRTSELAMIANVTQEVRATNTQPATQKKVAASGSPEGTPPASQESKEAGGVEPGLKEAANPDTTGTPSENPDGKAPENVALTTFLKGTPQFPRQTQLPEDKTHTHLHFSTRLAYTYKRDTVTVGANVVKATHGETKKEVLGSGDGTKGMQQFALKQSPLTYVAAATAVGAASTLHVYVNDIEWHEQDNLDGQGPKDRVFVAQTDDQDKTTVIFGNGVYGARLPTAAENVRATYRTHIGKEGNVDGGQITLLATRPLGVKGVINPKPATGGADHEPRDQARRNAPLAVQALDRIVSVQDYADFARTFAGIAKTSVRLLPDGRRQIVHLTIAGQDNIPIDPTSDLFQSLFLALRKLGNPGEPLRLAVCEVKLLVISMRVRVQPDYQLEKVVPNMRTALLNAFGFEQRDLGQPVYQSEVLSVVQQVPGVAFVEMEILDAVAQSDLVQALDKIHQQELHEAVSGQKLGEFATQGLLDLLHLDRRQVVPASLARPVSNQAGVFTPAQLVFLTPDIADTLIINELTSPIEPVARTRKVAVPLTTPIRNAPTGTGVMQ